MISLPYLNYIYLLLNQILDLEKYFGALLRLKIYGLNPMWHVISPRHNDISSILRLFYVIAWLKYNLTLSNLMALNYFVFLQK